jgi:hypothetical protein
MQLKNYKVNQVKVMKTGSDHECNSKQSAFVVLVLRRQGEVVTAVITHKWKMEVGCFVGEQDLLLIQRQNEYCWIGDRIVYDNQSK